MDASFAGAESTHAMLELLARMKEEAERTSQITAALDQECRTLHQTLDDLLAGNQRTEAEVAQIEARTLAAAGNARATADLLATQQAERLALDAEAARLEAELAQSECEMGAQHEQMVAWCDAHATELPELRCAFRKRCRDGYSNAVRNACHLTVMETEYRGEHKMARPPHLSMA